MDELVCESCKRTLNVGYVLSNDDSLWMCPRCGQSLCTNCFKIEGNSFCENCLKFLGWIKDEEETLAETLEDKQSLIEAAATESLYSSELDFFIEYFNELEQKAGGKK
jgi:predicted RNA-binding Zn-ribbon protein involved in translation (DUF1610 family)